jgi:pimeloyl-ACP methyl ester carboxylesterase
VRALSAKEAIAVLAHSWGSHVVLSALKAMPELAKRIVRLVLVNPAPLTSARHRAAGERLRARLPPHARNEIEALFADGSDAAGAELMRLALPYYTADAAYPAAMQFHYRIPVYRALLPALNDYDLRKVKRGKIVLSIIRGEQDYLLPSDTAELDAPGVVSIILPGIGHFPFAENPTLFSQTLRQLRE